MPFPGCLKGDVGELISQQQATKKSILIVLMVWRTIKFTSREIFISYLLPFPFLLQLILLEVRY